MSEIRDRNNREPHGDESHTKDMDCTRTVFYLGTLQNLSIANSSNTGDYSQKPEKSIAIIKKEGRVVTKRNHSYELISPKVSCLELLHLLTK
ncbi:hypothetical protein YC2023_048600 [Brassica napus]